MFILHAHWGLFLFLGHTWSFLEPNLHSTLHPSPTSTQESLPDKEGNTLTTAVAEEEEGLDGTQFAIDEDGRMIPIALTGLQLQLESG